MESKNHKNTPTEVKNNQKLYRDKRIELKKALEIFDGILVGSQALKSYSFLNRESNDTDIFINSK